jgi:chemotaxis protein methyltransferase CheR
MALGASQELEISDAEYRMFCELVKDRCGLHFDEDSRFLVVKRLARLVHENDVGSFSAYHYMLRDGGVGSDEFANLIDTLTTNETYFFREKGQLSALIDEIIPELTERRRHAGSSSPVSIWSAGCSSGEEAYSIIMMAKEAGFEPGKDLRVYASDISRAMLTKSRRGLYREASFRETSDEMRDRYFEEKDGQSQICEEIKRAVDFIHLNLMDRERIALLGTMDVILCRNVIIYFDLETKKRVIETFYDKLRPGGYLLLGHSESLINVSSAYALEHLKRDLVYRRPAPGESVEDPWHAIAASVASSVGSQGGPDDVS